MNILDTITNLSHEFGSDKYVIGGGGNTSCKDNDNIWVKPSGTSLGTITNQDFVKLNRQLINKLYNIPTPSDPTARESLVKETMEAAICADSSGRPSVEAPLHNVFEQTYVVHTHPTMVNGLTCAKEGKEAAEQFFPEALWVEYIDPGYTLCMEVRQRLQNYRQQLGRSPSILILQNHGVFIAGNTADEIREHYKKMMQLLEDNYALKGIDTNLTILPADTNKSEEFSKKLRTLLEQEAFFVRIARGDKIAAGPVTPDHIVYAKSYSYFGEPTLEGIHAFKAKHGYFPKIFVHEGMVAATGQTEKNCDLALRVALDGGMVYQLAEAFGGVQYMSDQATAFIENWEVESYRQKQIK